MHFSVEKRIFHLQRKIEWPNDGKTGLATPSFVRAQLIYNALATVANSAYLSQESLGFLSERAAALDLANFKL